MGVQMVGSSVSKGDGADALGRHPVVSGAISLAHPLGRELGLPPVPPRSYLILMCSKLLDCLGEEDALWLWM